MQKVEQILRYMSIAVTIGFFAILLLGSSDPGAGYILVALTVLAFFLFLIWIPIHVLLSVKYLNAAKNDNETLYLRMKLKIISFYPLLISLFLLFHFLYTGSRATMFNFLPVFVGVTFAYVLFVVIVSLVLKRIYKVGQLSGMQEQSLSGMQEQSMKWYKVFVYTFLALYFLYLIPALLSHYRYAHTFETPPPVWEVFVPFF